MSRRLALVEDGLAAVRALTRKGRLAEALAQAARLLTRPDLTVIAAADTHRVIAEISIDAERHAKARKHLRASLSLEPGHARTHYLMGLAFERDPHGDDLRAAKRFRKASELVPGNAAYRAAFGRAAVRCGRVRRGVRELLAAAEAAPRDTAVLEVVIEGLIEVGKIVAAQRIIVKARFLCPRSVEIRRLWDRLRFEAARRGQRHGSGTQDAGSPTDGGSRLLPFIRVVRSDAGGMMPLANVRRDVFSSPRPHLARLRATNADG
jgi:tetratricopeptide (TPR) repeat protein